MKKLCLTTATSALKQILTRTHLLLLFACSAGSAFSDIQGIIDCPNNNALVNPSVWSSSGLSTGPSALNPAWLIASISVNTNHTIIEELSISAYTSKALYFAGNEPTFWIWRRGSPSYGDFTHNGHQGMNFTGNIVTSNAPEDVYDIYVVFMVDPVRSNCEKVWFDFSLLFQNDLNDEEAHTNVPNGEATCTIFFSRYTDNWSVYNTPDLFVKDNDMDYGVEPYYSSMRSDMSVSILNTLFVPATRTFNGLNPSMQSSNYAQRSTMGNYNKMNVWVENRGCVATTHPAQVELFWTVNRTFEPWSKDWFNYQNNSFASSNFVTYTDASGSKKYPAGNQIALKDKEDYYSDNNPVTIPAGVPPSTTDRNNNEDCIGGFLTNVEWNPPLPEWYMQSAPNFHWHTENEPTLCYLAVI